MNFNNYNPYQFNNYNNMMMNNNFNTFNNNMMMPNNFNNFNNFNNNIMMMNYNNMIMMNNYKNMMMMNMMKEKQNLRASRINQILDESENMNQSNDNNNLNDIPLNLAEDENNYQVNEALNDVVKETIEQRQKYENQQNQNQNNNHTFEEVDPTFMHSFISDRDLFDGNGHNLMGNWAHGENRGGRVYNPPNGWIGFGLNVLGKYDNGNNDWLACNGRPGEWCIAYHGACVRNTSDEIKQIIKPILENNLRPGAGQAYKDYNDDNHPGQKVGVGVYCSPNPSNMDGYAGIIEVNGYRYKVAFMLRVKPDKIRYSNSRADYWVLNAGNGDFSEIRPYRFLIKKA